MNTHPSLSFTDATHAEPSPSVLSPEDAWCNNLAAAVCSIKDPRSGCVHHLGDILFCALCAEASGANGFTDIAEFTRTKIDWLRQYVKLQNGCPSHDTFRYVFMLLQPEAMHQVLSKFLGVSSERLAGEQVAMDGKTLRGSRRPSLKQNALHVLRAYATDSSVCLGYEPCQQKSNEITTLPQLLRKLNLRGSMVTMDAMGTQREIVKQITQQGADYLVALKGNQAGSLEAVEAQGTLLKEALWVKEPTEQPMAMQPCHTLVTGTQALHRLTANELEQRIQAADKELQRYERHSESALRHGRYEQRDIFVLTNLDWWPKSWKWAGLKAVILVRRRTLRTESSTGNPSEEWFAYLCSRTANAEQYAKWILRHWEVENCCHYVLDVTFGEDHCQVRDHQTALNLSILRDMATSLLKAAPCKLSIAARRKKAAWDDSFRSTLIYHNSHA